MKRDIAGWIAEYERRAALWIHDGNSARPHALLTSGNHSNGFFNSRILIEDDEIMREAAADLLELYEQAGGRLELVQGFVGPQTGATKLARLLSEEYLRRTGRECLWASPAKAGEGEGKSMVFTPEEAQKLRYKTVLLCEDVKTTGGSIELAEAAVKAANAITLPSVLILVNRSAEDMVGRKKIISLIHREMSIWTPDECPLCKQGSEAVRPKDNWGRLTAQY